MCGGGGVEGGWRGGGAETFCSELSLTLHTISPLPRPTSHPASRVDVVPVVPRCWCSSSPTRLHTDSVAPAQLEPRLTEQRAQDRSSVCRGFATYGQHRRMMEHARPPLMTVGWDLGQKRKTGRRAQEERTVFRASVTCPLEWPGNARSSLLLLPAEAGGRRPPGTLARDRSNASAISAT
jgi:hypothetical protein